jgi:hypothetical protein
MNIMMMKSRKFRWAVHVADMEEMKNAVKLLTEEPEEKSPLGRHRRILKEMEFEGVEWIQLARDSVKWRVIKFGVS